MKKNQLTAEQLTVVFKANTGQTEDGNIRALLTRDSLRATNHTIKTKFILVFGKLHLYNAMLASSYLSIIDTVKKTQNYQKNFGKFKIVFLP